MEDYIKTEEKDINHLLPLKAWDTIDSQGILLSLPAHINSEYHSNEERIKVLVSCVKELVMKMEEQGMLIKYLIDNSTYTSRELNLG